MASRPASTAAPATRTAELLRAVPLFSGLSEPELDKIARVAVPRALRGRQRSSCARATPGDTCYVLRAGARASRASTRTAARSRSRTSAPARSSASWRCSAARCARRRSRRSTTCRRSAILAGDLKRLLNEHPEIAVKLLGALGEKLREANARIARQSFQKVSSRVAGVLAELAETGSRAGGATAERRTARRARSWCAPPRPTSPSSPAPRARPPAASSPRSSAPASSPRRRGRIVVHDPPALHRYIY